MIPSRLSAPTRPVHDVRSCIVERVWVERPWIRTATVWPT